MDIQKKKVELLKCMPVQGKDTCEVKFLRAGFYDFYEKLSLNKDEYKEMLLHLNQEGLIKVDMQGWDSLEHASMFLTPLGYDYMINAPQKTIGFSYE